MMIINESYKRIRDFQTILAEVHHFIMCTYKTNLTNRLLIINMDHIKSNFNHYPEPLVESCLITLGLIKVITYPYTLDETAVIILDHIHRNPVPEVI